MNGKLKEEAEVRTASRRGRIWLEWDLSGARDLAAVRLEARVVCGSTAFWPPRRLPHPIKSSSLP